MSQATTRAGRRADIPLSDVSFWVNAAYQQVIDMAPHALAERVAVSSVTSGAYRIELPLDFDRPINLSIITIGDESGKTLRLTSVADGDYAGGARPLGTPNRYALYADWLELIPASDSSLSLQMRYYSFNTDLTALTDVPSIDTNWRLLVLYKAEAELWSYSDNPQQEVLARQRAFNYEATLLNAEAKRKLEMSGIRFSHKYKDIRKKSVRSFDIV